MEIVSVGLDENRKNRRSCGFSGFLYEWREDTLQDCLHNVLRANVSSGIIALVLGLIYAVRASQILPLHTYTRL